MEGGETLDKSLILCDCSGSIALEPEALSQTTGLSCSKVHSALCTTQIDRAAAALEGGGDAIFCCTQESRLFEALAAEIGTPPAPPSVLDLRDRAGWSADPAPKLPKMAALIAEATLPAPIEKTLDVTSEGLCLVIGAGEVALSAAEALKAHLGGVTVLLTDDTELPVTRDFDVIRGGRLRKATGGAFGAFSVIIDALSQLDPTGRGAYGVTASRDGGGCSDCDIILDLTGDTPLFPAPPDKREAICAPTRAARRRWPMPC